mmetsp:Transcript_71427/g.201609  ORF Transcript_71427/g.201609 Transcript_71427/m.201609 type:complete len:108 (-) Transcript_71427:13-336(-)
MCRCELFHWRGEAEARTHSPGAPDGSVPTAARRPLRPSGRSRRASPGFGRAALLTIPWNHSQCAGVQCFILVSALQKNGIATRRDGGTVLCFGCYCVDVVSRHMFRA